MQPARSIIDKCGGAERTAQLAECSTNWVYRWVTSLESGGTGGRVPDKARKKILQAALDGLVQVEPNDFELGWQGIPRAKVAAE